MPGDRLRSPDFRYEIATFLYYWLKIYNLKVVNRKMLCLVFRLDYNGNKKLLRPIRYAMRKLMGRSRVVSHKINTFPIDTYYTISEAGIRCAEWILKHPEKYGITKQQCIARCARARLSMSLIADAQEHNELRERKEVLNQEFSLVEVRV